MATTTSAPRRVPLAVTALCLVQFMDVLGVTVVVTALPSMLASLHASQAYSTLVATGYAMFFGGLLMLGARLGDRYGPRRTILASLAVFATGSAIAAAATSVVILTAGRCLQGAAAAASVPSALRLLTRSWGRPSASPSCCWSRRRPAGCPRREPGLPGWPGPWAPSPPRRERPASPCRAGQTRRP
jgi:MFS family permease